VTRRQEVEDELSKWLSAHHAVIAVFEAFKLGASYYLIRRKVASGEWVVIYPGVFRAASAPETNLQKLRAACLASGGLISHASAAWMWGMLAILPTVIEVSIGRQAFMTSKVPFTIHRSRDLDEASRTVLHGIEVTSRLRTLIDLAATGTQAQLSEAVDHVLAHREVKLGDMRAEIDRLAKQGRPGVTRLRQHLQDQGFLDAPSPSVLEARARRITKRLGIPLPEVEVVAGPRGRYRLDFAWRNIMLAVEVDGYTWHYSPRHKRQDEMRRQQLRAAGWTILVFDWLQVSEESAMVTKEIRTTYDRLVSQAS
jgi:hypothetical protein